MRMGDDGVEEKGEAWTTEERPRGHPQNRTEGQEEIAWGKQEGHPRGAQAPCEDGKAGESCSLRPGCLAVLSLRERKRDRMKGERATG